MLMLWQISMLTRHVPGFQGHGKPVDWWAFGVLVYELLAGFPPFYDDDPMETYKKVPHRSQ